MYRHNSWTYLIFFFIFIYVLKLFQNANQVLKHLEFSCALCSTLWSELWSKLVRYCDYTCFGIVACKCLDTTVVLHVYLDCPWIRVELNLTTHISCIVLSCMRITSTKFETYNSFCSHWLMMNLIELALHRGVKFWSDPKMTQGQVGSGLWKIVTSQFRVELHDPCKWRVGFGSWKMVTGQFRDELPGPCKWRVKFESRIWTRTWPVDLSKKFFNVIIC